MLLCNRSTFTGLAIGVCRSFERRLAQRFLRARLESPRSRAARSLLKNATAAPAMLHARVDRSQMKKKAPSAEERARDGALDRARWDRTLPNNQVWIGDHRVQSRSSLGDANLSAGSLLPELEIGCVRAARRAQSAISQAILPWNAPRLARSDALVRVLALEYVARPRVARLEDSPRLRDSVVGRSLDSAVWGLVVRAAAARRSSVSGEGRTNCLTCTSVGICAGGRFVQCWFLRSACGVSGGPTGARERPMAHVCRYWRQPVSLATTSTVPRSPSSTGMTRRRPTDPLQ